MTRNEYPPPTEHEYPPAYPKNYDHWAMRRAWDIMDILKPGIIPNDVRFFLAGAIAGALMRAVEDTPKFKED